MESAGVLSIGTKAILDNMPAMLQFSKAGVITINIQTLIRNRLSEDSEARSEDIVMAVKMEISELGRELSVICLSRKQTTVIFYLYDYYRLLEETQLRGPSKQRDKVRDIVRLMFQDRAAFPEGESRTSIGNMVFVMVTRNTAGRPHEKLLGTIQGNTLDSRVLMISHMPIDYLLNTRVQDFTLMKSFNAGFVPTAAFPEKVFGEKYTAVPFYQCTLKLFGDKVLIEPSVGLKEKRRIAAEAETGKWLHSTETTVEAEISMLNIQYKEK